METLETFSVGMTELEKAAATGKPVRLFFCTGYQAEVVIEDFDPEVIVCRKTDRNKRWVVRLDNLCTIEV